MHEGGPCATAAAGQMATINLNQVHRHRSADQAAPATYLALDGGAPASAPGPPLLWTEQSLCSSRVGAPQVPLCRPQLRLEQRQALLNGSDTCGSRIRTGLQGRKGWRADD